MGSGFLAIGVQALHPQDHWWLITALDWLVGTPWARTAQGESQGGPAAGLKRHSIAPKRATQLGVMLATHCHLAAAATHSEPAFACLGCKSSAMRLGGSYTQT